MILETKLSNTPWGFAGLGLVVYKRTYSRKLSDKSDKSEEWADTVERVIKACKTQLKMNLTSEEEDTIREIHLKLKGSVAGRFLWQMGTPTVKRLGLSSLQNCAFCTVDHAVRPFTWAMDMLMLGSGVGYNIQREFVYQIPTIKRAKITRKDTNDADFIVPDSREGWVLLLQKVLEAHQSGIGFSYSTVCVRSKGAPIKSFGGVASGPEELCWGMEQISNVLNKRANKKLRPIDALDIMNIIGYIVVAGNIRRSAQISIGDCDDMQFLAAKRWDLGNIPNWRAMSNNSVIVNDFSHLPEEFWEGYKGNGEPYGLINLGLAQRIGRIGEIQYPDPDVRGFNPCAEQPLANFESCCLAEVFLPQIQSEAELLKVCSTLYKICKHSLLLHCHHPETEAVVHKNMRMGIGITGYLQASSKQKQWLPKVYAQLRELDVNYSAKIGCPTSIKLTTVKPSGTLSLLAGTTPGCHPGFSKFHIRRMRISSSSPLLDLIREHGFKIEPARNLDGSTDNNTMIAEFPCKFPAGTKVASDFTAIDQLRVVKRLQKDWSDNAVSCTIYYKKEELPGIRQWLSDNFNDNIKSVSFLLHSEHGFDQAPLEEITEAKYNELIANITPLEDISFVSDEDTELNDGCASGVCPIK